jgi:biotin carboxyl carrier protein
LKIYVDTQNHRFEFDTSFNNDQLIVNSNGKLIEFELVSLGNGRYSLIRDNKSQLIHLIRQNGKYHAHVNGDYFMLDVEDERSRKLRELVTAAEYGPKEQLIRAPIPGLVVKINVAKGQLVTKGDKLIILEAMKMENVIKADCECSVEDIKVKEKETVQQNQVLIKLISNA